MDKVKEISADEQTYNHCKECGIMMIDAFDICDDCWNKHSQMGVYPYG